MVTLVTVIHIIVCFFLILVVLLQAGKGGGMGIAFGSSTSQQVFGGRGAGGFLERLTAGTAIVFVLTSLSLAYFASQTESKRLQERSERLKKDAEERKKKEAAENQKNEEVARKALEAKGPLDGGAAAVAAGDGGAAQAPAPIAPAAPAK